MRFRLKAFGLHLIASACALTLVLGSLYAGWYHWPGWYLTAVPRILLIVAGVDLALGPTLTLIIANPSKPRRTLARDVAMIAVVQLAALIYGAQALWQGRPLYYTFSANRLETVQASDVSDAEAARARAENPAFAPYWYSRPRWVWAPLPDDPDEAAKIVSGNVFGGGQDVIDMPRYFKPWQGCLSQLRGQLTAVGDIKYFTRPEQKTIQARMAKLGLSTENKNALVMWGGTARRLVAVFDLDSLKLLALIKPD
jgi:hypothetical protein